MSLSRRTVRHDVRHRVYQPLYVSQGAKLLDKTIEAQSTASIVFSMTKTIKSPLKTSVEFLKIFTSDENASKCTNVA